MDNNNSQKASPLHTRQHQQQALHFRSSNSHYSLNPSLPSIHLPSTALSETLVWLSAAASGVPPAIAQKQRFEQLRTHFHRVTTAVNEFSLNYFRFTQNTGSSGHGTYKQHSTEYDWLMKHMHELEGEFAAYSQNKFNPQHEFSSGVEFGKTRSTYRLVGSPMRGANCVVWRVEHVSGRTLAARFYARKHRADFERERNLLKKLPKTDTSNYMRLHAVIEDVRNTVEYYDVLITDYCEITLKEYWETMRSKCSADAVRLIMSEVLQGVEACHSFGIVHGDLRPENIMLYNPVGADALAASEHRRWMLTGFQHARFMNEHMTASMGEYASPEAARARMQGMLAAATPAVDMWGVGRILHFMLASRPFWSPTLVQQDMTNHLASSTFTVPIDGISHAEAGVVRKLLAAHPSERMRLDQLKTYRVCKGKKGWAWLCGMRECWPH